MDEKEISVMTHRGIMHNARRVRKLTQETLANRMDMKRNALCQNLNRPRISLEMFVRILDAMDYDVVVVDRTTGEITWKVDRNEDDV